MSQAPSQIVDLAQKLHADLGFATEGRDFEPEVVNLILDALSRAANAATRAALEASPVPSAGAPQDLEIKYRALLWIGHGHQGIYGDDGEMQCGECAQFGVWDYKRAPLADVERAVMIAKAKRVNAALAATAEAPQEGECSCGHDRTQHYYQPTTECHAPECRCLRFEATAEPPHERPDLEELERLVKEMLAMRQQKHMAATAEAPAAERAPNVCPFCRQPSTNGIVSDEDYNVTLICQPCAEKVGAFYGWRRKLKTAEAELLAIRADKARLEREQARMSQQCQFLDRKLFESEQARKDWEAAAHKAHVRADEWTEEASRLLAKLRESEHARQQLREALEKNRALAYWQPADDLQALRTRLACIGHSAAAKLDLSADASPREQEKPHG